MDNKPEIKQENQYESDKQEQIDNNMINFFLDFPPRTMTGNIDVYKVSLNMLELTKKIKFLSFHHNFFQRADS